MCCFFQCSFLPWFAAIEGNGAFRMDDDFFLVIFDRSLFLPFYPSGRRFQYFMQLILFVFLFMESTSALFGLFVGLDHVGSYHQYFCDSIL